MPKEMAVAKALLVSKIMLRFDIENVSQLESVWSEKVFVQGVSLKIEVRKSGDDEKICVCLRCEKEDKISGWSHAASATFKLLSFDTQQKAITRDLGPFFFDNLKRKAGTSCIVTLAQLFYCNKNYVQDNKIQLECIIEAEYVHHPNRSKLKMEIIDRHCDCGAVATFRVIVSNIKNLMAVRSNKFVLHGHPWYLSIFKRSSKLALMLIWGQNQNFMQNSCKIKASVKLISSTDAMEPREKENEKVVQGGVFFYVNGIIPWDELMKPDNGFINNDAIELEVKVEVNAPQNMAKGNKNAAKRSKLECPICFDVIGGQDTSFTPCGHLFCTTCIKAEVKSSKACPLCLSSVTLTSLRRAFLPLKN